MTRRWVQRCKEPTTDTKKVVDADAIASQRQPDIRRWAPVGAAFGLVVAVVATNLVFGRRTTPQVQMEAADAATQGFSVVSKNYPEDAPRPQVTESTGYCESDPAGHPATDAVRQALTLNYSFPIIQDGTSSKDRKTVNAVLTQQLDKALDSLFAGSLAKERKDLYQESIDNIDPATFTDLGGGVSRMECEGVISSPNGCTIRVTATSWGVFSQKNDDGSVAYGNPVGALEATAVVDRENRLTSLTIEIPVGDGHP